MADASKLKGLRRSGLGAPPSSEEARTDLAPPLPDAPLSSPEINQPATADIINSPRYSDIAPERTGRVDGRTMRRSGRTLQFATRVSPEFDGRLRQIAIRDGMLLVEVLEHALDAYEASKKKL